MISRGRGVRVSGLPGALGAQAARVGVPAVREGQAARPGRPEAEVQVVQAVQVG